MTERVGGGDATRRIAQLDTISLSICWSSYVVQERPSATKSFGGFLKGDRNGQVEGSILVEGLPLELSVPPGLEPLEVIDQLGGELLGV